MRGTRGVAQVVECMSSKNKTLSSKPRTTKDKQRMISELKEDMYKHLTNSKKIQINS
jgi:hypothetical protein